jgi:iron complex outermembrane receptor protein
LAQGERDFYAITAIFRLIGDRIEASHDTELFSVPAKFFAGIDVAYNNQTRGPSQEDSGTLETINPYNYVPTRSYNDIINPKIIPTGPIKGARNELLTVAGYAESKLTLLPDLNLVTGVRVDDISLDNTSFLDVIEPTPTDPGRPAGYSKHWQTVTWRAGLMYDITPTFNVFANYSTAASPPAGLLTTASLRQVRSFDLSTGRQAEVGSKFDFWGGRGSGTIAAYWIERNNISTNDPNNPNVTLPVGAQSSIGVEANIGLQITPEWSVQGNMAYTDAEFDEFNEGGASRVGNRPANVPKWTANGWLNWAFYKDWQWSFGTRFVDDRFADNANLVVMPSYAVFDMQMSWQVHKNALLTARVKNLTDETYAEWGNGGSSPLFLLREPRMFQMEVKFDL